MLRTPPSSGVVGSDRVCGANLGSRVFQAGFTGTRRVSVSAFLSAGIGNPASALGGPEVMVMLFGPFGEVDRSVEIAVNNMATSADE